MNNNFVNRRRFPLIRLLLAAMLSLASITTLVNTQPVYASPTLQSESDDATQDPMEDGVEDEDGDDEDGDDEDGDDEDEDEDDEDEDDEDGDEDENEVYGTVDSMPSDSLIGNWIVDGVQYVATESTEFEEEDGAFAVGSSVELEFTVLNGVNQLDEIETHSESDMDSTDEAETSEGAQTEANSYTAENLNELVTLAHAYGIDLQSILLLPTAVQ